MVLHSTPQTPMTQITQFQHCQKFDDGEVQYSNNGSITSPVGGGQGSVVNSLRRHNQRMAESPHHHIHADLNSIGGNPTVMMNCVGQQPCSSPMISFKPMNKTSSSSTQNTPGILASPLPQPPNVCAKGTYPKYNVKLNEQFIIGITKNIK